MRRNWKIVFNLAGNFYGQGLTILIQIVALPIFLHYWTISQYGSWVLVSSFAYYMSMADVGVAAAASNKMAILAAKGFWDEVNRVFQSALALTTVIVFLVFALAILSLTLIASDSALLVDGKATFVCLAFVAVLNIFPSLIEAACRAVDRNAQGLLLTNTSRLIEWLGCISGLISTKTFLGAALGMLAGRVAANFSMFAMVASFYPKLRWGISDISRKTMREMMRPAMAFMAFPVGSAMSVQGINIVVGILLGPVAAAIFSAHRTLSRSIIQLMTALSHSVWPEFSRMHAGEDIRALKKLHRETVILGSIVTTACGLGLVASGSYIMKYWSHGKISFDHKLFICLMFSTVSIALWQPGRVLLMSANKHSMLALQYLGASVVAISIAWFLEPQLGMYSAPLGLVISEAFLIFWTGRQVKNILAAHAIISIQAD